jgi:hypothetical protein
MSARAPRRRFATPFVLTLAATVPACVSSNPPPPSSPNASAHDEHGPGHVNPPKPTPTHVEPTFPPSEQTGTNDHAKGTANTSSDTMVGAVAAPGSEARGYRQWSVTRSGTTCSSMVKVSCPEGAMCNPPPPAKYECPKQLADNGSMNIIQHADKGDCFVDHGEFKCPEPTAGVAVSCNPPRPQKVACPK